MIERIRWGTATALALAALAVLLHLTGILPFEDAVVVGLASITLAIIGIREP